jgi:hypothetical protein
VAQRSDWIAAVNLVGHFTTSKIGDRCLLLAGLPGLRIGKKRSETSKDIDFVGRSEAETP